jgi:hypothetical protein
LTIEHYNKRAAKIISKLPSVLDIASGKAQFNIFDFMANSIEVFKLDSITTNLEIEKLKLFTNFILKTIEDVMNDESHSSLLDEYTKIERENIIERQFDGNLTLGVLSHRKLTAFPCEN